MIYRDATVRKMANVLSFQKVFTNELICFASYIYIYINSVIKNWVIV